MHGQFSRQPRHIDALGHRTRALLTFRSMRAATGTSVQTYRWTSMIVHGPRNGPHMDFTFLLSDYMQHSTPCLRLVLASTINPRPSVYEWHCPSSSVPQQFFCSPGLRTCHTFLYPMLLLFRLTLFPKVHCALQFSRQKPLSLFRFCFSTMRFAFLQTAADAPRTTRVFYVPTVNGS